jgi:hypothetical protein
MTGQLQVPRPFTLGKRDFGYRSMGVGGGCAGGEQVWSNIVIMPELYLRFNGLPALSIVTILTEIPLLHHMACLTHQN